MKKPTLVVLVLCLVALLYFGLSGRGAVAPAVAAKDERAQPEQELQAPAHTAIAAAAEVEMEAAPAAAPPDARGQLGVDERETLVMYDEMRTAFDQHRTNCLRMGEAIDYAVTAHTAALTRLRDQRDALSPAEQTAAQQRIEAAEGPRLKELRHAMEQAVAKCKHEPVLLNALRKLGTLNAPRGAEPTR